MNIQDGQWWSDSWNPIKVKGGGWHCSKCSAGCLNCWSEALNLRFGNKIPYDNRPVEYEIDQKVLDKPWHWNKPRKIFVCDMLDLFHSRISNSFRSEVFTIIAAKKEHTFLILTKRPQVMLEYCSIWNLPRFKNLWLGVSVENQKTADERIPLLLQIPAAHRFINFEPLLEDIKLPKWEWYSGNPAKWGPNWVIIGCESGTNRRPCKLEWVRNVVEQCKAANTSVWIKQLAINGKVNKNMKEWPKDLQLSKGMAE